MPLNERLPGEWVQVGADIDGEAVDDFSGWVALSADGGRVAVGALGNSDGGDGAGHVRVFDWDGSGWVQVGADIDGEAAGDLSGWSVALSADGGRVAIGATGNSDGGRDAGQVRVFDWDGSGWVQVGADIDGEAAFDDSGSSIALSADGSRVAIGARFNGNHEDALVDAGHVRVFDWDGSGWVQVGADIDGEAAGDNSGWSVALSADGGRVAIGAVGNSDALVDAGHVRVFDWDGSGWVQVGADIDGEAAFDYSGESVALSADGGRVAIGAAGNSDGGRDAGQVRVFDWDGSGWVQLGADIDGEPTDESGWSVALSADGSRVVIGAWWNEDGGRAGLVRVFDWDGSGWVQIGTDIDGEAAGDLSGESVALSADGSRVAIGAQSNGDAAENAGHVRLFGLETPS